MTQFVRCLSAPGTHFRTALLVPYQVFQAFPVPTAVSSRPVFLEMVPRDAAIILLQTFFFMCVHHCKVIPVFVNCSTVLWWHMFMYVAWSFCSFCFAKNFLTCTLPSHLMPVGQLNNAFKHVFIFIIEQSEGKLDLRFFKGN